MCLEPALTLPLSLRGRCADINNTIEHFPHSLHGRLLLSGQSGFICSRPIFGLTVDCKMNALQAEVRRIEDAARKPTIVGSKPTDQGGLDIVQAVIAARRVADQLDIGPAASVANVPSIQLLVEGLIGNSTLLSKCVAEIAMQSDLQRLADATALARLPRRLADVTRMPLSSSLVDSFAVILVHAVARTCLILMVRTADSVLIAGELLAVVLREHPAAAHMAGTTVASAFDIAEGPTSLTDAADQLASLGGRLLALRQSTLKNLWRGVIEKLTTTGAGGLQSLVWRCLQETDSGPTSRGLWGALAEVVLRTRISVPLRVRLLSGVLFRRADMPVTPTYLSSVLKYIVVPAEELWASAATVESGEEVTTLATGTVLAFILTAFRVASVEGHPSHFAFRLTGPVSLDGDFEGSTAVVPLSLDAILSGITARFKSHQLEVRRTAALIALLHAKASVTSGGDNDLKFEEFPNLLDEWLAELPGGGSRGKATTTQIGKQQVASLGLVGLVASRGGDRAIRWDTEIPVAFPCMMRVQREHQRTAANGSTVAPTSAFGQTVDDGDEGEVAAGRCGPDAPSSHDGIPHYATIVDAYRALLGIGSKPNENERERSDCIEGALRVLPTLLQDELSGSSSFSKSKVSGRSGWSVAIPTFGTVANMGSSLDGGVGVVGDAVPVAHLARSRASALLAPIASQLALGLVVSEGSYPDVVQKYLDDQRLSALTLLIAACPQVSLHRLSSMLFHSNYSIHQRVLMYHAIRNAMLRLQEVPLACSQPATKAGPSPAQHRLSSFATSYPPIPPLSVGLGITDAASVRIPHLQIRREERAARRLASQGLPAPTPASTSDHLSTMARARHISNARVEERTRRWGYAVKGRSVVPAEVHSENQLPLFAEAFLGALLHYHDDYERRSSTLPKGPSPPLASSPSQHAFSFLGEDDAQYCPGELLRCIITLFEGLDSPAALIERSTSSANSSVATHLGLRALGFLMKALHHPHGVVRAHAWWASRIVIHTAYKSAEATQDAAGSLAVVQMMHGFIRAARLASVSETVLLARDAISQFLMGVTP